MFNFHTYFQINLSKVRNEKRKGIVLKFYNSAWLMRLLAYLCILKLKL